MTVTPKTAAFYLAGSWRRRENLRKTAEDLTCLTGWQCNSRWLEREEREDETHGNREGIAKENVVDVLSAQALVHVEAGQSTNGGRYVEVGLAHTAGLPIIWVSRQTPGNIFAALPGICLAKSIDDVARHLLELRGYPDPEETKLRFLRLPWPATPRFLD